MSFNKEDCIAICLAMTLILAPLAAQPAKELIQDYWICGDQSHDGASHSYERFIAGATFVVAFLTLGVLAFQAWIYIGQQEIMADQAKIARHQLIAAHRPHLRVRNVVITPAGDTERLLFRGARLYGQCHISNIGGTDAKIEASFVMIYASQMGLPMALPYEGKEANNPVSGTIAAGASVPFNFEQISPFAGDEAGRAYSGDHPLYVMGWISYSDSLGNVRRTAFCRRWDPAKRRFAREDDDPDYEHEE